MRHIKIPMLLLLITAMYSCKKDKKTDPEVPYKNDIVDDAFIYSQLKVGNYWIYQQFAIDSAGTVTPTAVYDSCYIEKDTIVRGKTYFKIWKPFVYGPVYQPSFIRDSADCIVQLDYMLQSTFVIFSCNNFSTPLHTSYLLAPPDTLFKAVRKMTDIDLSVSVPAGSFITRNAQQTYYFNPQYSIAPIRYSNTRYAKNVGIISETRSFYLSTYDHRESRLVRYHLN